MGRFAPILVGCVMMTYSQFIRSKQCIPHEESIQYCAPHVMLFPFQRHIVTWALQRGRFAIFADCGLGKTFIQLEWARHFNRTLIFAPLAVGRQTVHEGEKIGINVVEVKAPTDDHIQVTNYEKIARFEGASYDAIVLDESSILKSFDGKTRARLLAQFTGIPHRLCCTATPAPNDIAELANHAEFLGVMKRQEMLATFFVHDDEGWRIKGHAESALWRWVATWSCFVRSPSDLGYPNDGFVLPSLTIHDEIVNSQWRPSGRLFADIGIGIRGRLEARRATIKDRVRRTAEIIQSSNDQWLVWCGLNDEANAIRESLNDSVQISGSDDDDTKIERESAWRNGQVQTLITKARIFGYGMNWQHCHRMVFLGLGDSYEQYYQSLRRCWRYGQTSDVEAMIVISDAETAIAENIRCKEENAMRLAAGVAASMRGVREMITNSVAMETAASDCGEGWKMFRGDCVEHIREIADRSIGLSMFSPPFASLYTYSASDHDMGNSRDYGQFFDHFRFLIPELLRITIPGRRACVHVQQIATTLNTHGVIGLYDFRADVVREFMQAGWIYDGEVVIDKNPQAQAIRTHSKALLFVQKNKDSIWSRPALADYILLFRSPGENSSPIKCDITNEEWIQWARPIWYGIDETDTLNGAAAREEKDERHICPLQLGTIERCIRLWSNPGDLIFDPFAGIGSTGFVALQQQRRFLGIELKESYWKMSCNNLRRAQKQIELFA